MSKKSRKCPNCGATVPQNMKYCRRCKTKVDSGRVENLAGQTASATKGKSKKASAPAARKEHDALENLPRPIRPEDVREHLAAHQQETAPAHDAAPAPEEVAVDPTRSGPQEVEPREILSPEEPVYDPESEEPVYVPEPEPYREPDGYRPRKKGNVWQIVAVAAIIVVILAVVVALLIQLNKAPEETPATSETFEGVHVINTTVDSPDADPEPVVPTPGADPEEGEPPAPAETPEASPSPSPTADPEATAAPDYTVTEVSDTVYVSGNGVNIRSGPGTDYDIINSESTGYELKRTGKTDNGWSRVEYQGYEGYVLDEFITTEKPEATPAPDYTVSSASGTVKVTADANLRTGPGTDYERVTTVSAGTELERTGTVNGWTRVKYNGQERFISNSLIETVSSGNGDQSGDSGTLTVRSDVNVRSGPGTSYDILGVAKTGDTLTTTGKDGSWYKVEYDGQEGYVSEGYVDKN